jgi:hypothetical protein
MSSDDHLDFSLFSQFLATLEALFPPETPSDAETVVVVASLLVNIPLLYPAFDTRFLKAISVLTS